EPFLQRAGRRDLVGAFVGRSFANGLRRNVLLAPELFDLVLQLSASRVELEHFVDQAGCDALALDPGAVIGLVAEPPQVDHCSSSESRTCARSSSIQAVAALHALFAARRRACASSCPETGNEPRNFTSACFA